MNSATSHAVNRHIDTAKGVKTRESIKDAKITQADFERALKDITPAFGVSDNAFEGFPSENVIMFSKRVQVRSPDPPTQSAPLCLRALTHARPCKSCYPLGFFSHQRRKSSTAASCSSSRC